MKKSSQLNEAAALMFFFEVAKAVEYLHSKNLVHRDIKPENVLIGDSGEVKLGDFGFCASYGQGEERQTLCGTKEYLCPEIITGQNQSEKVDVWCLGVLLYELIHKRVPFEGASIQMLMHHIK